MGLPKGFRKNVKIVRPKEGVARREELIDNFVDKGTFLPRGVSYEDMDKSFIDFVDGKLEISIDGEKVPVIFLTLQRWSEFSKTWQHSDKYKNIKMPFITIVRKPDVQAGTNQAGNWNIPGGRGYTYIKVPTFEGGRKGIDVYKVPQPTSVDIIYDVRMFTNKMRNLNKFNVKVLKTFNSRQYYLSVKGHPMPALLEAVSDESNIDDFENRRFYTQAFNMKLLGYILDEDDFEVIPTVNRLKITEQILGEGKRPKRKSPVNYLVEFKTLLLDVITIPIDSYITIDSVNQINNVLSYELSVNGVVRTLPLVINGEDEITITIVRNDNNAEATLSLGGYKNK